MAQFDFPSTPALGQVYSANNMSYVWDGVGWRGNSGTAALTTMTRVVVYAALAGTFPYAKPANLKSLQVELFGAGGGGGGAALTAAGNASAGGGGGGGSYCRKLFQASELLTSENLVLGAGGIGGDGGAVNGATGGTTTFKTMSVTGGSGGANGAAGTTVSHTSRGNPGVPSGGDFHGQGNSGFYGMRVPYNVANAAAPGYGGAGYGRAQYFYNAYMTTSSVPSDVVAGDTAGGNGAACGQSIAAAIGGGNGGTAYAIFTEYYNENDTVPIPITDATFSGKVRLTSTSDASDVSTGHPFQIGLDNSLNIAIDNNEIQARNNGAATSISINLSGGGVSLGSAAAASVVTLNGGALKFPAINIASTDVNVMDDYEEGLFTPVMVGSTLAGVGTYTVQTGRYTKWGNRVSFDLYCGWSAHTGTGNMRIEGLPFIAGPTIYTPCSLWATLITFVGQLVAYVQRDGDYIVPNVNVSNTANASIAVDTAGTFCISGVYQAA